MPGISDHGHGGGHGLGIPGLGNDVAPPAFVQQQQQQAAAAARARAAADDPFGSSSGHHSQGPQEVRLVIDEKPVDDKEVGRKRTGSLIAVLATAVVMTGAGYLVGSTVETKNQERQTLSAVTGVRTEITRIGDVISNIKQKVDHAAERANINTVQAEEGAAAAPTHPPEVDEQLLTWFREQQPEPPLSPDVYAGRVGRLRAQLVGKITLVQLQLNDVWRQLQLHTRQTNIANVRASVNASNPATNELAHMMVIFARNPAGAAFAQLVTPNGPANAQGAVPVQGQGIPPNTTRTPYQEGDITGANLTTIAIPVAPAAGLAAQAQQAATFSWVQYRTRLTELKTSTDALAQNHSQLMDMLSGQRH